MAYYNRKGVCLGVNRKHMKYLSSGECASVYHNNEIILKEYFSETCMNCRLSITMFDLLKGINDAHFIELFDVYSDMSLSELIKYYMDIHKFTVDACIAKYYADNSVNALYESTDYILDNFNGLEKLFNIFTDNSIITDDVKRKNAILSRNRIIIIDPDTFYISSLPKKDIELQNKKELLQLFSSICVSGIGNIENHDEILKKVVLDLTDIEINNTTNITNEISKKLRYVKKPMDYLVK